MKTNLPGFRGVGFNLDAGPRAGNGKPGPEPYGGTSSQSPIPSPSASPSRASIPETTVPMMV